jgi:hypothetical protein
MSPTASPIAAPTGLEVADVCGSQRAPCDEICPACERGAVDEGETAVAVDGREPEQAQAGIRAFAVQPAGAGIVAERGEPERDLDLLRAAGRLLAELPVAQLVQENAERRSKPEPAECEQLDC